MFKTVALILIAFTIVLSSFASPRGGRGGGGGRSGGGSRGSSSHGSSKSWGGSHTSLSSSHGSSYGSKYGSKYGSSHGSHGDYPSGSWYRGYFHSPYYSPYSSFSHHTTNTNFNSASTGLEGNSYTDSSLYPEPAGEENHFNKGASSDAIGYAISRTLNHDFLSIFNMIHDISKVPNKIKNKEFAPLTTTQSPVFTYNLNDIITTIHPLTTSELYPVTNTDITPLLRANISNIFYSSASGVEKTDEDIPKIDINSEINNLLKSIQDTLIKS